MYQFYTLCWFVTNGQRPQGDTQRPSSNWLQHTRTLHMINDYYSHFTLISVSQIVDSRSFLNILSSAIVSNCEVKNESFWFTQHDHDVYDDYHPMVHIDVPDRRLHATSCKHKSTSSQLFLASSALVYYSTHVHCSVRYTIASELLVLLLGYCCSAEAYTGYCLAHSDVT